MQSRMPTPSRGHGTPNLALATASSLVAVAIAAALLVLLCRPAYAQQDKPAAPSVLIIGDNVCQLFAKGVAADLKGQATVQVAKWPEFALPSSTNAIEHIDLLLGLKDTAGKDVPEGKRPTWNLVHMNVGLGDLIHRVPNLKSHRVLPYDLGGVITTDAALYEKNLDTLIQLIKKKAPKAKIVWASTTPIRSSSAKVFKPGSEVEYNQIAQRVMKKHGVPINDMHAHALERMNKDKPSNQDPFFFDGKPIHAPIVDIIARELNLAARPNM